MLSSGSASLTPSRRLRVLVHLSVLLLLFMSMAQAAHTHSPWASGAELHAPNTTHTLNAGDTAASELTCPLCMFSHSVLPSFPALATPLNLCTKRRSVSVREPDPLLFWTYDLFGRPPPKS
jgi:hypothetical protein